MIVGLGQWAITIVAFLLILWLVVVVHEFGHFLTARLAGIRVLEFGLGYPPRAKVLFRDHDTTYTLNWLPLGGFVLLEGEEKTSEDERSFSRASLPKQVTVLAAGVFMNVVLAFVLFFFVAWFANPLVGVRYDNVEPQSPAAQAGLQPGEVIQSVNGQRYGWMANDGVLSTISNHEGQTVTLGVVDQAGHGRTVTAKLRTAAEVQALQGKRCEML